MNELFLIIINMSISAGWLVLAVMVLRLVLRKVPKWVNVLLWGIVAVRLLCPFFIESSFSLMPKSLSSGNFVSEWADGYIGEVSIIRDDSIYYNGAVAAGREPIPDGEGGYYVVTKYDRSGEPSTVENTVIPILTAVWGSGMFLLALYSAISYWRLRRKVDTAVLLRGKIFQSENVSSPFVLGIIRPRIYLPFKMDAQALEHVIAHEQAHIRWKDHWWKPLGFLLLTVHWFNPLMWLAYVLLCKDIELACDERVIKELGREQRADYTQALVACSVNRRVIAACPLAFGEVGVKDRVKSVMNYKKPAFWVVVLAVLVCAAVAVCFLTNPLTSVRNPWVQEYIPGTGNILGNVDKESFESVSENFAIGADQYGRAVFKDPYKAFETLKELYADGIALIREEQDLPPFSRHTYDSYKNFGWQSVSGSAEEQAQASFVTKFLDIYENSFTKDIPEPNTEIPVTAEQSSQVTKWFDYTNIPFSTEDELTTELSEFPGVTFRYNGMQIIASKPFFDSELTGNTILIAGMPIWNAYFTDLTGDDYPEICATYSLGSGIVDTRFIIYDYVNGVSYEMADRGYYDFSLRLNEEDGCLYADKRAYSDSELVSSGRLVFEDNCIRILAQDTESLNNQALAYLDSTGDLELRIADLLDTIQSSPATSSNPGDYIEAHEEEYQELLSYGEYTLRYCFSEFLSGGRTDLRGHIMAAACEDISNTWGEALLIDAPAPVTGQDWFDAFKGNAERLADQFSDEELEKNYPASWLLLKMMNE